MGGEASLGCRCLEAAKSAACRELEGPRLPLPRAVQSSAGSADAQVPALLLPVLPVPHTPRFVVTQSWALAFGAWQVGYSKRGFWEAGSCQLLVGEDSVHTPWPSAAFPSCGAGRRWTQSRIFCLLRNLILISLPWKSEAIGTYVDRCVCVYTCIFSPFLWDTKERTPFRAPVLAGTCSCSTGTFHQTRATNCAFPVQELRLVLLPYPQLLCQSVGMDKHGNAWCFWNVERLLFCRSFRLQTHGTEWTDQ